jgi:hypothetical protein
LITQCRSGVYSVCAPVNNPPTGIFASSAIGKYFTAVGVPTKNPNAKTFWLSKRLKQVSVFNFRQRPAASAFGPQFRLRRSNSSGLRLPFFAQASAIGVQVSFSEPMNAKRVFRYRFHLPNGRL